MLRLPVQVHFPSESLLQLYGADAMDLLQRISASELRDLEIGASRRTLFCDDKGRLVDLPLLRREPDALWLLASPGQGERLARWIERWIIVEDIRLRWPAQAAWLRVGPTLEQEALAAEEDPALLRCELADLQAEWLRAGIFRPRAGLKTAPHPLELGLKPFISFEKGCYIGQEVVARMQNYEKVRRGLAWLRGRGAVPAVGTRLELEQESTLVLDSMAEPDGAFLALVQAPLAWSQGARIPVGAAVGELSWVNAPSPSLNPASEHRHS